MDYRDQPLQPWESLLQQVVSVSTTAVILPTTARIGRQDIIIQNLDSSINIWVGSSTVTSTGATRGLRIGPGQMIGFTLGQGCPVYAIATSGTVDVAILEGAVAI